MTLEAICVPVGVAVVKGCCPPYPFVFPVSFFGYPSILFGARSTIIADLWLLTFGY